MINALEGFSKEWYTPEGQPDDQLPTRFELQPLDGEKFTHLHLMLDGARLTGESVTYALREGLTDWVNFSNSQGMVPYSMANHRYIPMVTRIAIASRIYEISMLSQVQEKNS